MFMRGSQMWGMRTTARGLPCSSWDQVPHHGHGCGQALCLDVLTSFPTCSPVSPRLRRTHEVNTWHLQLVGLREESLQGSRLSRGQLVNTVSTRIHKCLRPRVSSRTQMFMGRSSKQCVVNWSLWLFSSVDSWFPGHRPLGSRGMASLKQMQLLIDTNVQTGSFIIIVTYSTQSEHPRVSTHQRAHTSGQLRQVGSSRPYFLSWTICVSSTRALPFTGLKAPISFSGLACCYSRTSTSAALLRDRSRSPRAHRAG